MMSSSPNPPVLNAALPSGDIPAQERATATTSALDHQSRSGQSTPGPDIPGAFPSSYEPVFESTSSQGVGDAVIDTARQYLPQSVLSTMETYIGSNGDFQVKSSPNDIPHQKSISSQEILGTKPGEKIGGVRSLPGTFFESGVATLPDERSDHEKSHTMSGYLTTAREAFGQLSQSAARVYGTADNSQVHDEEQVDQLIPSENVNGGFSEGKQLSGSEKIAFDSAISTEREAAKSVDFNTIRTTALTSSQTPLGSIACVSKQHPESDSFAAVSCETGHVIIPDQKSTSDCGSQRRPYSTLESSNVEPIDAIDTDGPPSNTHKEPLHSPDLKLVEASATDKDQELSGYGEDYHSAELHPTDADYSHGVEAKASDDKNSTMSNPHPKSKRSSVSGVGSSKKVGIKKKISGGAKVIMGTIGRNHDKIEAGKKILHGKV